MDSSLVDLVHEQTRRFNNRDYDGLVGAYAPDASVPGGPDGGPGTPEQWMAIFRDMFWPAVPDMHLRTDDIVTAGDVVAYKWSWTGRYEGRVGEMEPTGETIAREGLGLYRVAVGKIVGARLLPSSSPVPWMANPESPATPEPQAAVQSTGTSPVELTRENERAFNERDYDTLLANFDPDARILVSPNEEYLSPQQYVDGFRTGLLTGFPELQVTAEPILTAGTELIANRWRWTARHTGELNGLAPTGKTISHQGIAMVRVVGGKIDAEVNFGVTPPEPWFTDEELASRA